MSDFTARKISHPVLGDVEIYLVSFQTQEMIEQFLKKSPWFDREDAIIGRRFIIEYNPEKCYYEIFDIQYYQNHIKEINNIYGTVYNEILNFFNSY